MKLLKEIQEQVTLVEEVIEEGTNKKHFYIEGICMQANLKNKNGRIYPKDILQKEVANYIKEKVENKTAYGELGHPDTPTINPDRISHRFISIKEDGDNFVCKAILSENPMGQIAKNLMKEGGRIGISSRALGSLKEVNGTKYVCEDLKLCTAGDLVIDPSAPDAWMQGIYEQAEWVYVPNKGWSEQIIDESRQELIKAAASQLDDVKIKIFENFLKRL